jgi:hypothetical protein
VGADIAGGSTSFARRSALPLPPCPSGLPSRRGAVVTPRRGACSYRHQDAAGVALEKGLGRLNLLLECYRAYHATKVRHRTS